jgi:hypothetical protein
VQHHISDTRRYFVIDNKRTNLHYIDFCCLLNFGNIKIEVKKKKKIDKKQANKDYFVGSRFYNDVKDLLKLVL